MNTQVSPRSLTQTLVRWLRPLIPIFPYFKRQLKRFHGGVFPPYKKSMSLQHPLHPVFFPQELVLPLQQHIGQPAKPTVQIGERVLKNQKIADVHKGLGAPIHAPTSGTILAIEHRTLPHPSGLTDVCIVIKPDQQDQAIENALQTDGQWPDTPKILKEKIFQAGIVGMGGAGYPTYAKIPETKGAIHTLLINGAECEPYITCDDLLMQTHAEQILTGAQIVAHSLGAQKILCGIEDNKPQAIAAMRKAAQALQSNTPSITLEIQVVPTVYPMGGQKQLTYELTGIEVPAKAHAVDIGMLMMNVATFAAIADAIIHGNPLTRRLVTVTGEGVETPFNIEALLGTPFNSLITLAKPKQMLNYPLVMGGPMMVFEVQDNHVPVIKTTNCILAIPPYVPEMVLPCIRCGECMDACPVNLLPQQLYWFSHSEEWDKAEQHHLFDCIECGCCSYVCPSNIPLVQYYRHAKSEIKLEKAEKAMAEKAKLRHEQRQARIEKEKQAREARLKAKKAAVKKEAAAKTAENAKNPSPAPTATGHLSARDKAILAAKQRMKKPAASPETETTQTEKPATDKKQTAAQAAAKARAAAAAAAARKKASQQSTTSAPEDTQPSSEDTSAEQKRAAAMAAAKARAAAAARKKAKAEITSEPQPSNPKDTSTPSKQAEASIEPSDHTLKQQKRAAAMAAAKARAAAAARKKAEQGKQAKEVNAEATLDCNVTPQQSEIEKTEQPANANASNTPGTTETMKPAETVETAETLKAQKRAAAMAAAKARAATARRQKQSSNSENAPSPESSNDKESKE